MRQGLAPPCHHSGILGGVLLEPLVGHQIVIHNELATLMAEKRGTVCSIINKKSCTLNARDYKRPAVCFPKNVSKNTAIPVSSYMVA